MVVAVGYGLFLALVTGSRVTSQSGSDFLFSSAVSLCNEHILFGRWAWKLGWSSKGASCGLLFFHRALRSVVCSGCGGCSDSSCEHYDGLGFGLWLCGMGGYVGEVSQRADNGCAIAHDGFLGRLRRGFDGDR